MAKDKKLRQGRQSQISAVNQRMAKEGRWDEYSRRRIQLRRDGVKDDLAWRIICNLLPPMDGSPPEARVTVDLEPILTRYVNDLPVVPTMPAMGEKKGYYDVAAGISTPHSTPSNDKFVGEIKGAQAAWVNEWHELGKRVPVNRIAQEVDIVRWVFNNAGTPPEKIPPEDVPSLGALKYLEHVQSSPIHYSEFVKTNWSKMLPDKKQLEYESRLADDGKRSTKLLDDFLSTLEPKESVDERFGDGNDG